MGCCGSDIIALKNEIENLKKIINDNNVLAKNDENLLINKENNNNNISKDSNCSIKIESKEIKEIIDNESKKEEEKFVLNENKEEIINSKNDGNSFKINNNENDDCLYSVTYSNQLDLQENNEIINIGKSVEKEKLNLDENKEEINNLINNGLNKINKDEFPKCNESLKLKDLAKFIIEKSSNLSEIEKAFFIYNWIALNISLDLTLNDKNEDKTNLENIIKKGKSSNFNFAILYKHLGEKINLKIKTIEGYSKNLDRIENIPKNFIVNHLYNFIDISGKFYLIDSCFGSGTIENSIYIKEYNNFHFFIEPSKMILFNFPKDENYQLLEKKVDYETFISTSKFYINFFNFNLQNISNTISNYICKGIKTVKMIIPNNIEIKLNLLKENEKTYIFAEYGFKYNIMSSSYSPIFNCSITNPNIPLEQKTYSISQLEYGKNKLIILGKKKGDEKNYQPVMEELFIYEEESELEFSILETKFENEFRPNERLFTSKEILEYGKQFSINDLIYHFEPNHNLVTLNDKIEYTLTVDEKTIKQNTSLIVEVEYIKNGQNISKRGVGLFEKIGSNKFLIIAKFMKKGLYEIKIFIGEDKCTQIKVFKVLWKHDFCIDAPLEKSKFLGGEGYKDEEIKLLKENGRENINNILNKAKKRTECNLDDFTKYLKENTTNLNDLEKAFLIFKWVTSNIEYDFENLFNDKYTCKINEVFKIGKTVCSGYA